MRLQSMARPAGRWYSLGNVVVREQVALAGMTTFGVGGRARFYIEVAGEEDLLDSLEWAESQRVRVFVLGGGSNLLVPDEGFDGLVLHVKIRGLTHSPAGAFAVGAGESWETLVNESLAARCAGLECLAGIPGSVGGTPVQNVGAYGQEVAQTIASVRALDRESGCFAELSHAECGFRYRESRFNSTDRGRFVVTEVRFQLRPGGPPTLTYPELKERFDAERATPSLEQVASAVRAIRRSKGMLLVPGDPDCRSAGSFFKNPVITEERLPAVKAAGGGGDAPSWPMGDGRVKLPAAWLLERAGFHKGFGEGAVRISSRHTLALTNRGGARFADVEAMEATIVQGVWERFGIRLEREPVVLR